MLLKWGLTPQEFGDLERHQKLFIQAGWAEYVGSVNSAYDT